MCTCSKSFGIFLTMLLKRAFGSSYLGIKLHTRTDGNLFNLARLKSKRKVKTFTVRDLLCADDAALVAHSAQDLQTLLSQFSSAFSDFGLTISLRKTKVLSQWTYIPPWIKIDGKDIENVKKCTLAQVFRQMHHWAHRLIVTLVRLQALSLDWLKSLG